MCYSSDVIGKTVGSYTIVRELGEGGMGAVYLAEHKLMGKQAAVKVLLPQYCAVQEVVERFFNEAKAASMIKHPGIVDIYDFGTQEDGSAFIVMELLEGEALSDKLKRDRRLPNPEVALLGQQMAKALEAAHALGIVHRDLKPDNVFLEPDSAAKGGVRPKILDFGIAKLNDDLSDSMVKTRTGAIMGTPIFMSPEQCSGAGVIDGRADVYSLGCILHLMVCARPPFVKKGAGALIAAHLTEQAAPLSSFEASVDPKLEAIIMSTLAKSPDERPQSMGALANALGTLTGETTMGGTPVARANTQELFGEPTPVPPVDERTAKTTLSTSVSSTSNIDAAAAAALEGQRAPSKGIPKIAYVAGVAVAAAAAAVLVVGGGGDAKSPAEAKPLAAAPPPVSQPVVPEPQAEPVVTPPKPGDEIIKLELHSEPEGATVYRRADGVKLGITPYTDEFAKGRGELELLLKRDRYEQLVVSVPLQANFAESVTLVESKRSKHSSSRGRKGRSGKTDKKPTAVVSTKPTSELLPTSKPKEPTSKPKEPKPKPEKSWGELAD